MFTKDDCVKYYNSMLKKVSICGSFSELYECSAYAGGYLRAMRDIGIIDNLEFLDMATQREGAEANGVGHINGEDVEQF